MTTQSKHTPTPWTNDDTIIIAGSRVIASVRDLCLDSQLPEDRANAAFITRACNNHARLVSFIEGIHGGTNTAMAWVREEARAILAAAKE